MSLVKLIHNYTDYNLWANYALAKWLITKPADILDKETPSSFLSIFKTLAHIHDTERFWAAILQDKKQQIWINFDGANEDIIPGLIRQSELFSKYIRTFSEVELIRNCCIDAPWMKGEMPKYEFIQHCINHSSYHRGQIITIARVCGLNDPPNTDYNYYNMAVKKQPSASIK